MPEGGGGGGGPLLAAMAEAQASLRTRLDACLDAVHASAIRPLLLDALHCQRACLGDTADASVKAHAAKATRAEVEACMSRCNQVVDAFQQAIQAEMNQIQTYVARGVGQCNDAARASLPASPSERNISRAQQDAEKCAKKCLASAEAMVPKAEKRLLEHAKKLLQASVSSSAP